MRWTAPPANNAATVSDASWPSPYRFLSTVDRYLQELAGGAYLPSTHWTLSRGTEPYYGYVFYLSEEGRAANDPRFWIGFHAPDGDTAKLELSVPSREHKVLLSRSGHLVAVEVASEAWKAVEAFNETAGNAR